MAEKTQRVRMKTSMAGPFETYAHGREYDLPVALAEAFCADGRAALIEHDGGADADELLGALVQADEDLKAEREAHDMTRAEVEDLKAKLAEQGEQLAKAAESKTKAKPKGERTSAGPAGGAETRG